MEENKTPLPTMPDSYDQVTPTPPTVSTPPTPEPTQPPTQPIPVPEQPNNKISQKLFIPSVVLLLIITVVLVAFKFIKTKKVTAPQPTPTALTQTTPSPTLDPTANWKTYTNNTYGFSFKYPSDWDITEQTDSAGKKIGNLVVKAPVINKELNAYSLQLTITDTKFLTATDYVQDLITPDSAGNKMAFDSSTQITIDNQNAIRLTNVFAFDQSQDQVFVLSGGRIFRIFFPVGKDNPNIDNAVINYPLADQILSTFKFLGANDSLGQYCAGPNNLPCPASYACKLNVVGNVTSGGKCVNETETNP